MKTKHETSEKYLIDKMSIVCNKPLYELDHGRLVLQHLSVFQAAMQNEANKGMHL